MLPKRYIVARMNTLSGDKSKQATQLVNQAREERTKKLKEDFNLKRLELANRNISRDSGAFIRAMQDLAGDWLDESISWVWSRLSELLKTADNPAGLVQEVEQFLKPHVDDLEGIAFGIVFDRNKPDPQKAHRQAVQSTLAKRKDAAWSRLRVDAGLLEAKLEKAKRSRKRQIVIALIGAVAVIGAAIIGNWAGLFQGVETKPLVNTEAAVVEDDTTTSAIVDLDSTAVAESDTAALE